MDCQFYQMLATEFPDELQLLRERRVPDTSFSNIFGEEVVPHFYERVRAAAVQPDGERLGAIVELRRPVGYGPIGSTERVKFYIDWHNTGRFTEVSSFAGEAMFVARDKESAAETPVPYLVLSSEFRRPADAPLLPRYPVRILLSWGEEITGPDFQPRWGHCYECRLCLNGAVS